MKIHSFQEAKKRKENNHEIRRYVYSALSDYSGESIECIHLNRDAKELLGGNVRKLAHVISCGFVGAEKPMSSIESKYVFTQGFETFKSVNDIIQYIHTQTR